MSDNLVSSSPWRLLVLPAALAAALLMGCGDDPEPDPDPMNDTADAGPADTVDTAQPDTGPSCTTIAALAGPLVGNRATLGRYQLGAGTADLGFGDAKPDVVFLEFYGQDGALRELVPGTYDLGSSDNGNYASCLQCVTLLVDFDGSNANKVLLQTSGALTVSLEAATGAVTVAFGDLTLTEVDINTATYESTLVQDGVCAASPGTQTTTCAPLCQGRTCGSDNCGSSCGACPSGQTCRGDGSQCDAPPDPTSMWTLTVVSGTVSGENWDVGLTQAAPPDPAVCFEVAFDDWQCSLEQPNTTAPVWNWNAGVFSAQALMAGLPVKYIDIDDGFIGGTHDEICEPGVLPFDAENFASGGGIVQCEQGTFTFSLTQ